MVSADMAAGITAKALAHASLQVVPEEIGAFRRFCEGPLRFALGERLHQTAIEQVFERLGHVLWMATSDVSALETARSWSRANPLQPPEIEPESGVRHLKDGSSPPETNPKTDSARSGSRQAAKPTTPPTSARPSPVPLPGMPVPGTQVPGMPVPGMPVPGVLGGRADRPVARTEKATHREFPAGGIAQLLRGRALSTPEPARASSKPPTARSTSAPSSVVLVTLDAAWVAQLRLELAPHCPVRPVAAAVDLVAALAAGGDRLVVLIDTALPSIDVATFAGLAAVLPATARVVLWGATSKQHARLAAMFPLARAWVASEDAAHAGRFVLELP